jgi:type II secretory pathway pseudopilin PulG
MVAQNTASKSSSQGGFTVPELLVMILVVVILSALLLTNYQAARAKERDTQRVNDINQIDSKLESYYNIKNAYPATFDSSQLLGIEKDSLRDPNNKPVVFATPQADATAAQKYPDPTRHQASYLYIPYPTGCTNAANNCTGFVLKSFIEKPTSTTPSPYVKVGINNN